MQICDVCGNPFDGARCPYCDTIGIAETKYVTVNLEHGKPTVADAEQKLTNAIHSARMNGVRILRIVHGYGSSGRGGAIRSMVRRNLADLEQFGSVQSVVFGEDTYSKATLLHNYPKASVIDKQKNPGETLVEFR